LTLGCGIGALGQIRTGDDCAPGDHDCTVTGLQAPLAVGASMRPSVGAELRGSGSPSLTIWSAAPDVITVLDGRITAHREGVSALVVAMRDGTAVDFVHVWTRTPDRIELHGVSPNGDDLGELRDTVELVRGESLHILPRPYADAQHLLGDAAARWEVEPPLVDVLRDGSKGRRRLVARKPGRARLTVMSLELAQTLDLVVHP